MAFSITGDVCQVIVSGQPIKNNANFCYVNELAGVTGISVNEVITYQNTVLFTSGNEVRLSDRFDDKTYYGYVG